MPPANWSGALLNKAVSVARTHRRTGANERPPDHAERPKDVLPPSDWDRRGGLVVQFVMDHAAAPSQKNSFEGEVCVAEEVTSSPPSFWR
jgi:hypothetical protein